MTNTLQTPLQFIKGVGPHRAAVFADAGLHVLEDLLLRLPSRYEDRDRLQPIIELKSGDLTSVTGEVLSCGLRSTRRRGFQVFEMLVGDASGQMRAVFLNQPFLKDVFVLHQHVVLFGKVEPARTGGGLQFTNPQYEVLPSEPGSGDEELIHTGRIVPVYEKLGTVTPKMLRRIVHAGLHQIPAKIDDPLPAEVRARFTLADRRQALVAAHFPEPGVSIDELNGFRTPAQQRLIFEEFFVFQFGLALRRRQADTIRKPRTIRVDDRIRHAALAVLPFRLTKDQRQALKEIVTDLQRPHPMNRLLQGDVGSGKTIVALLAALVAMENGLQVAVMSPTELLSEQHYLNISRMLAASRFETIHLTGAMSAKERRDTWERIASGAAQLVVGTHALVQEHVRFKALGFVIIDEQHRFGVVQRASLRSKGLQPDVLVMTATPIPRTLALTAYGDLDVSVIHELPPGRPPVKTRVLPESRRGEVYDFMRRQLTQGRQAYVVYPLVEESAKLDVKAATEMAAHLEVVFGDHRVGLVHGRMRADEREQVMRGFTDHAVDLLVATTVVEVGVDVPNASVMVVEHAERFGLAQLHQLRGRVGRGPHESHCLLLHEGRVAETARVRLDAIAETTDGFEIAERDLELRGPGDFFGTRQSGIPTLRVGDLLRDHPIMEAARRAAVSWLTSGKTPADELEAVLEGWSERFGLVGVG